MDGVYRRIYAVVSKIPRGRVASYGQVARLAGLPRHARQVGYAMAAIPDGLELPWHRVINSKGEISPRGGEPAFSRRQRVMLEDEGVRFDAKGRTSLTRFGWRR